HGGGDELGGDDESVPAVPVADQLSERRERGSTLAGAEGRNKNSGVMLVEIRGGPFLVAAQHAEAERRIHRSAAFDLVYQAHTLPPDCSGRPAAQSGRVSISHRRIAFASSARAASTSQTISSCVVMRIGMKVSLGLVSIRVTAARSRSAAVACTAFSVRVPLHSFARPCARRNEHSLRFSPVGLPSLSSTSTSRHFGRGYVSTRPDGSPMYS